jgi:hypothetical protein
MPSKTFPGRFRPEFEVLEWRQLGNQPTQIEQQVQQIGKRVKEPTIEEELNDSLPI